MNRGRKVVGYVAHGCMSQGLNGRVDVSSCVDIAGHRGVRIRLAEEQAGRQADVGCFRERR